MSVWRLVVNDATNVAVATYGPGQVDGDGGIVGLPSFNLDPSGNCISLTFDAVAKRNAIAPRSIITLERYDGSTWVAWWKGMVTTVGTTRSDQVQRYAALGLKQYYYERVLRTPRWPEQPDVSTDAANIPDSGAINGFAYGVTRTAASTPTLGFSIGVTLPYRQMFGEFLDQRANQVGSFIVPTAETYTYDGVTYNAGDTVPATVWGVNADGLFFFRRTLASSVAVTEADPEVKVTWAPKSTEGKANAIDFTVIADVDRTKLLAVKAQQTYSGPPGFFGGAWVSTEQTFVPLSTRRPSSVSSYPVIERRFQVENPLDVFKRNSITFNTNSLWSNISNATDSDPLTYANFGGTFTAITATGGTVTDVGDFRIHTFTSGGTFTVSAVGSNPQVEYLIVAGGGSGGASNFAAGGGGAGGMLTGSTTVTATSYTITVGGGGAGVSGGGGGFFGNVVGNKGSNSTAFGFTAEGGGRGGAGSASAGGNGGSGGGASSGGTFSAGGTGNPGEGNDGGSATQNPVGSGFVAAGGGGGASQPGESALASVSSVSGAGGLGLESTISGSSVTYATGGAGKVDDVGGGTSGAANTGNGGDGYSSEPVGGTSGAGGSGIVIIRYRLVEPPYERALGTPFDFSSPSVISTSSGGSGTGAYVVSYASDSPVAFAIKRLDGVIAGTIVTPEGTFGFTAQKSCEMFFEYPATNTDTEIRVQRIIIPSLAPVGLSDGPLGTNTFYVFGVNGLRIYDAAFYNLDSGVVTRIAEGLIQDPNSEAAVVDVQGYSPVATEVVITAIDNPSPVTMPVERVEYAITSNDGIVTRYYAGQRFDPELQTEATVIDGAIRRLTGSVEIL